MAMGLIQGKIQESPEIEVDITLVDSFVLNLRWPTAKERDALAKQCTEWKRGQPDLNRDKFARAYCKKVILGWSGLTAEVLPKLGIVLNKEGRDGIAQVQKDNNGEIPFNINDAIDIYQNALPERFANKIKEALDEVDDNFEQYVGHVEGK